MGVKRRVSVNVLFGKFSKGTNSSSIYLCLLRRKIDSPYLYLYLFLLGRVPTRGRMPIMIFGGFAPDFELRPLEIHKSLLFKNEGAKSYKIHTDRDESTAFKAFETMPQTTIKKVNFPTNGGTHAL